MSDMTNAGGVIVNRMSRIEDNYVSVRNEYARDRRLSYRARGILVEVMSHKDDHPMTLVSLAVNKADPADKREGLDAVRGAVNELERAGYLIRTSFKNGKNRYTTKWILTDPTVPLFEVRKDGSLDNPTREIQPVDNSRSALDNPTDSALDNPTNKETYLRNLSKADTQTNHSTHAGTESEAQSAPSGPVAVAPAVASGQEIDAEGGSLLDAGASVRYSAAVTGHQVAGTSTAVAEFDMKASLRRAVEPAPAGPFPTPCPAHKFIPCMPNPATGICPDCGANTNTGEIK